jgi:hypothetical protein
LLIGSPVHIVVPEGTDDLRASPDGRWIFYRAPWRGEPHFFLALAGHEDQLVRVTDAPAPSAHWKKSIGG